MKKLSITLLFGGILFLSSSMINHSFENSINQNSLGLNDCDPKFKIEGINDAKGEYNNGNESWTIYFADDHFAAFYTKDGKQDEAMKVQEIKAISSCKFGVMMEGISGEMVPSWTLVYNEAGNYYDLHVHNYDAMNDEWYDKVFKGNSDNG